MTIERNNLDNIDFSDLETGKEIPPIHPSEYLKEILDELEISAYKLAKDAEKPY